MWPNTDNYKPWSATAVAAEPVAWIHVPNVKFWEWMGGMEGEEGETEGEERGGEKEEMKWKKGREEREGIGGRKKRKKGMEGEG